MKNQYPTIFLFCAVLCIARFTAGEENTIITDERVENTVIQQNVDGEKIADISASLRWQSKGLSEVLSGIQFGSPPLSLTAVESLEKHSCEEEASTFGHEHVCEVAAHEIFCEMSKLMVYVSMSTQNLEVNAGPLSNATDEAASYVQMVFNGALPEIIEVSGATFEDFINNPENVINLVDALKRSVPTSGIIRSATRLAIAINKFVEHAYNLLVYMGVPNLVDFFRQVAQGLVTVPGALLNFLVDNVLYPVANTLIETIAWWLMIQNNFPGYFRQLFYKYLTVVEEIIDITRASYNGYSASGFSQIMVDTVLSKNSSLGMMSMIQNYSTANQLTMSTDTGSPSLQSGLSELITDVTKSATEDAQPWLIPAITKYSLSLLRPAASNSRVIDVSISDVNIGDDNVASVESSPVSSSGIAGTLENDLTSYSSPLISSPSISSGNNVVQYSAINVQSKDNTLSISDQASLVPRPSDFSNIRSESSVSSAQISESSSNLSVNDGTIAGSDQISGVNPIAPSKISASSSSLSMTDETVVASGQSIPLPSKISESSSSLQITDKTVVASGQPSPINYPTPPKISESASSLSITDQTLVTSNQPNPLIYPIPSKISESSSSLSMTDETIVASDQPAPVIYPAPSKVSASSSSLSMTDETVVASGQPNPLPSKISESSSSLSMTDETVVASVQPSPINYPVPSKVSASSSSLSMTDETVVASGQPNPLPSKISESSSSLSMTDETVVASGQPNPLPSKISESSSSLSMTDETVVASDQSSIVNSNSLDSSIPLTSGTNIVSENLESSATIAKTDNSFSRIINSYLPRGNPRGVFNLGSLSSLSSSRINTPTCGTSTFLSSLSNLNNFLNNIVSSPLYIPLKEIASALNNVILSPGDVIVIFLRNNLGLIGRIDGGIQISFRVYRLRSTVSTNSQEGVNIWHMQSREFPSCERRIRSLFQNY
ncbi:flocculation protein FLO11-like [Ceratina calcarata]|uniref:Flocculation protein FLO11-like n=1 Tax=Ceratina calcarata TaxID=156304 RepID=A0AAJ7S100_9HYME|nr:flocculation protein FLO11-like [Ceratina calcarata]